MSYREERYMASIAGLVALLLAATNDAADTPGAIVVNYCYWVVRIFAEGLLFVAVRTMLERYGGPELRLWVVTVTAILISHVPFVLLVTTMDLVLGYPEIGIGSNNGLSGARLAEFGLEIFYLLDNHIFLCALLTIPRIVIRDSAQRATGDARQASPNGKTLLPQIDPPLDGEIQWIEAQEHYVRIVTTRETRMVLARFSDITRDLPGQTGIQVHRSHWVAYSAIAHSAKRNQNLHLHLKNGDVVPVSRSFRTAVEARILSG